MSESASRYACCVKAILLTLVCLTASGAYAQREREVVTSHEEYGAKFFDELRSIFGRFRDADLKRVFQSAHAIQCSDLVTDRGEWRQVAFFNENRKLGDWYRTSLDEVKSDLAAYVFKGGCGGQHASVQVTTKFPVDESISAYQQGRISFRQIDISVNSPVTAAYESQTQAYVFDLPYLFKATDNGGNPIYTLNPRRLSDRYAADVTSHWECKSVTAEDVTYEFLICHTTLIPRNGLPDNGRSLSFGASAYSILSDGKEASSSVRLTFGPEDSTPKSNDLAASPAAPTPDRPQVQGRAWRPVVAQVSLVKMAESQFRLRFNPESWKERIGKTQLISDGILSNSSAPPAPSRGKDYCVWRPSAAADTSQLLDNSKSEFIVYSLEFRKEVQSAMSVVFKMENDNGLPLGALQCFLPKSQTPADITAGMWLSIVGTNIALEVPRQ